jgi:hypothetical protein
MIATLGGYLFTLMAHRPLGLQGTRGGPEAAPGWAAGAGAVGHVAAPELSGLGSGSWSRRTRGGPGAALGWAAGAGAAGHVTAPKPTSAGRRGSELQVAWQRVDTRPTPYLNLELVYGVPDLQGTDTIKLNHESQSSHHSETSCCYRC